MYPLKKLPTKAPSRALANSAKTTTRLLSGIFHWLKRRWARLAAITAVESRYAALGYIGSTAQQLAATFHSRAQAQGDWREDGAFRQREEETASPYLGGGVEFV